MAKFKTEHTASPLQLYAALCILRHLTLIRRYYHANLIFVCR